MPFLSLLLKPSVLVGIIFALTLAWGGWQKMGKDRAEAQKQAVQASFDQFKAQVRAEGEAAQKAAKAREEADQLAKEKTDAENARRRASDAATIARLRKQSAGSSGGNLSAPAPSAASPERTCFDPAKLDAALRRLDEGILGIVEICGKAVTDLDDAKKWAQSISVE